jgi:hypothetical protein
MLTLDEITANAPPDVCFRIAADVEGWPDILPHYRWVRFKRKDGFAHGLVEMAAYRHFGPIGYPTWWVSEMTHSREKGHVYYRHVDGITKGMDVRWEISGMQDGRTHMRIYHEWDGPAWPAVGGAAANLVIGPHFVSFIAGRTLAGIARAAEGHAERGDSDAGVTSR